MKSADGARKRTRKRVLIMRELEIDGKPIGQAIDLSADGMYITTSAKFEKGAAISLKFQLENHPIETKARVLYLHEGIGMGVKFLALPHEDAARIKAFVDKASPARQSEPDLHRRNKILIIDDTPFYRTTYQQRFLSAGFSVQIAPNGVEGLKVLLQERPHLVLLDLVMDGMDGYKVLHIIKSHPEIKDIPVIILTVRGAAQEVSKAIELGAVDYLVKATTPPNKVVEKVKDVLRHRQPVS